MSNKDIEELSVELLAVMRRLRGPDGCPWDREQTHRSLKVFLMEECGELMDAIEDGDDAGMAEELGDVLMHVFLHSAIAEERDAFTLEEVFRGIVAKMKRRHPHVFGDESAEDASSVIDIWEKVKRKEKPEQSSKSAMDGVPRHCPALVQAEKLQRRAAKFGFDWSEESQIMDKIEEEARELREAIGSGDSTLIDEEIGDMLFAVSNLGRFRNGLSSEELLANANRKFSERFRHIERRVAAMGRSMSDCKIEEMEELWQEAKHLERNSGKLSATSS